MGLANIQAYHLQRSCGGKQPRRATAFNVTPGSLKPASASTGDRDAHEAVFPSCDCEQRCPCLMKRNRPHGFNRDPKAFRGIKPESVPGVGDQRVTGRAAVGVQAFACPGSLKAEFQLRRQEACPSTDDSPRGFMARGDMGQDNPCDPFSNVNTISLAPQPEG